MTDPIADMLTRIRNALIAGHKSSLIPASKIKVQIARILKEQGYIADYRTATLNGFDYINVDLAYAENKQTVIKELKRISKPSRRVYVNKNNIPRIKNGMGICILSTSKGIMTGSEARAEGVGGEIICSII